MIDNQYENTEISQPLPETRYPAKHEVFSRGYKALIGLLVALLITIPIGFGQLGIRMSQDDVLKKYLEISNSLKAFLVDTYVVTLVHGQTMAIENNTIVVKSANQSVLLSTTDNALVIKGKSHQGQDLSWKAVNFSELKVGDEVYSEGYYSPENRYVIPDYILIKLKE